MQLQFRDFFEPALLLILLCQSHGAIAFNRPDEGFPQFFVCEPKGFIGRKPTVPEHSLELDMVELLQNAQTGADNFILAPRVAPFDLAALLVDEPFCLLDDLEGERQRKTALRTRARLVDEVDDVYPFDISILGVVVMPTDNLVLRRMRLLLYRVIYFDDTIGFRRERRPPTATSGLFARQTPAAGDGQLRTSFGGRGADCRYSGSCTRCEYACDLAGGIESARGMGASSQRDALS